MADLHKFKEHFILLCEAGFIAVNQADEDAAIKLFKASELLNPKNSLPKIGLGYMHMMKLELKQACKMFEEVISHEPDNEMAKTFLGISYALTASEVSKGEQLLEKSAEKTHNPMIKNLAISALDFVEKFVKKAPTPVEMQKKQSEKEKKKKK
jgi:Tfp pilus assembly protein PilF